MKGKADPKIKATIDDVIKKAVQFYSMLLTDDGHWTGDYGGPHFLLPGLIVNKLNDYYG